MSNIFQYVRFRICLMKQERLWNKLSNIVQKLSLGRLGNIIENNNLLTIATDEEIMRLKSWSSPSGRSDYAELMSLIEQKFYEIKIPSIIERFDKSQLTGFKNEFINDVLFSDGEKNYLIQHPYFWQQCKSQVLEQLEQLASN